MKPGMVFSVYGLALYVTEYEVINTSFDIALFVLILMFYKNNPISYENTHKDLI